MRPSGAKANAVMSSSMVVVGLSSDCARAGGENAKRKMPQSHTDRIGASAAHREKKWRVASGEWRANTGRDVIPSGARNLLFVSIAGNSGFLARKPPWE